MHTIADLHIFVKLVFPSRCRQGRCPRPVDIFFLSLPHHTILLPSSKWRYYSGAHETFLSRLINNVYTAPGEFSTVCRILRSTPPRRTPRTRGRIVNGRCNWKILRAPPFNSPPCLLAIRDEPSYRKNPASIDAIIPRHGV